MTCINSVGNTLDVNLNNNCGVIDPKNGLGGLGGDFILPVALSNVYQFKQNLPELDIIGCGGVKTGKDVFKHILVGASMVQIGTLNYRDPSILSRFNGELINFFKSNNIKDLSELLGACNEG